MASLLIKAAKGNRAAITRLYNNTKADAFFVAQQILGDDAQAQTAVADAYGTVLSLSSLATVTDEAAFGEAVFCAVAQQAKTQLLRRDSKALRAPADRRFDIRTVPEKTGSDKDTVFAAFTPLQRLIFVLHTAASLSEDALTVITKLDRRTLAQAIGEERGNVDKILGDNAYEPFVKAFVASKAATVPEALEKAVAAVIDTVVKPVEDARKKRNLITVLTILGICLLLVGFSALLIWDMTRPTDPSQTNNSSTPTTTTNAAHASVGTVTSVKATHYADIDIKDYGVITVALDSVTAPETVTNFLMLADSGFYDGLTFHRIMEGFMMQGGDPNGNGSGGSDRNITGEFADNGFENPLSHVRGAISMARATDYNSGSSQFFIVHEDSTFLDGQYAAFGYVTEGMDIVDKICTSAEPVDNNGTIPSTQQPIINTITVRTAE